MDSGYKICKRLIFGVGEARKVSTTETLHLQVAGSTHLSQRRIRQKAGGCPCLQLLPALVDTYGTEQFNVVYKRETDLSDYCIVDTTPESRLSQIERLTLTGGEELERALGWIARQFLSFSLQKSFGNIDLTLVQDAAAFYNSGDFRRSPQHFFRVPALPKVNEVKVHGLADGEIVDLSFESSYRVQYPGFEKEYDPQGKNRIVHARYWRHHATPTALMVAIHGWTMGDQRLNSLAFRPGYFYHHGMDVALIELPFHGRRAIESGALFPSTNVVRTNEAMGQVISDLRALRGWLETSRKVPFGWVGLSLGAYAGLLWSALDRVDFAVPIVPMVSMPDMAWEMLRGDGEFRRLKKAGLTLDLLQDIYRVHSPLCYSPKVDPKRMMIIGGIGDRMVPARQVKQLHDSWGKPEMHWFRGGHAAQFKRSRAFDQVVRFLVEHRLLMR